MQTLRIETTAETPLHRTSIYAYDYLYTDAVLDSGLTGRNFGSQSCPKPQEYAVFTTDEPTAVEKFRAMGFAVEVLTPIAGGSGDGLYNSVGDYVRFDDNVLRTMRTRGTEYALRSLFAGTLQETHWVGHKVLYEAADHALADAYDPQYLKNLTEDERRLAQETFAGTVKETCVAVRMASGFLTGPVPAPTMPRPQGVFNGLYKPTNGGD